MVANAMNNQAASPAEDIAEAIIDQPGESYRAVLRKSFRVPQDRDLPLRVMVGGKEHVLVDSSESGLKLLLEEGHQLKVNQVLKAIELRFMEQTILVTGTVMHISQTDEDDTACGVKLEFPDAADHQAYRKYHAVIRERLFRGQHESSL